MFLCGLIVCRLAVHRLHAVTNSCTHVFGALSDHCALFVAEEGARPRTNKHGHQSAERANLIHLGALMSCGIIFACGTCDARAQPIPLHGRDGRRKRQTNTRARPTAALRPRALPAGEADGAARGAAGVLQHGEPAGRQAGRDRKVREPGVLRIPLRRHLRKFCRELRRLPFPQVRLPKHIVEIRGDDASKLKLCRQTSKSWLVNFPRPR